MFASSAAVYGPSEQPLRETAALDPDDVYGVSKLVGEQLCELASRQLPDAQLVALRLFNTIGPEDPNQHLIPRLIGELSQGADRVRLGNLETVRDYIYVDDVAEAILAALAQTTHGFTVVNVGTGVGRSVSEVVAAFERLLDRPLQVASTAAQRRAVDRPLLVADRARAGELFGWEPRCPSRTVSHACCAPRVCRWRGRRTRSTPSRRCRWPDVRTDEIERISSCR